MYCLLPLLLILFASVALAVAATIYYLLSTIYCCCCCRHQSIVDSCCPPISIFAFSHFSPFLVSFPVSRLIRIVLSRHFSPRFFLLESSTAAASAEPNELARQMDDYKRTSVARWHLLEMGIERTPITTAVYIPLFFPFLLSCFLFVSLVESTNNRLFTYKHV